MDKIISEFLASVSLPTLPQTDLSQLNHPFSIPEIEKLIKSLPKNKSPGPDGYSSEYCQLFSTTLSPHLLQVFNTAMSRANFPPAMLTATIITIPKLSKEPNLSQNFRPISLIKVDMKVYAKLIANRLATIIPSLINPDQVVFVSGRQDG